MRKTESMKRFVIGTAGHIDHGKTALVKTLTGKSTDRLAEEQVRGLSIELGFAPLPLSQDLFAGIVDVPGHQNFIRTMIRGATGIEGVIFVVSGPEGINRQTVEHFEICKLLGIRHAVIAITKVDLIDAETLDTRTNEVTDFLKGSPFESARICPVDAITKVGIENLRKEIEAMGARLVHERKLQTLSLPIDRVFSKKGLGTIATGTLGGTSISVGDPLVAWPGRIPVSVKSLQIFETSYSHVEPCTRVAIHLSGEHRQSIRKGMLLIDPRCHFETRRIHVDISWIKKPSSNQLKRLQVLYGTRETQGRVVHSNEIRFSKPQMVLSGERLILRTLSPSETVGGAIVLDPLPNKMISEGKPKLDRLLEQPSTQPLKVQRLAFRLGMHPTQLCYQLKRHDVIWIDSDSFVTKTRLEALCKRICELISKNRELPKAHIVKDRKLSPSEALLNFAVEDLIKKRSIQSSGSILKDTTVEHTPEHPCVDVVRSEADSRRLQ